MELIVLELIKTLPNILTALGIIVTAYFTYKNNGKLKESSEEIVSLKQHVNSKMDQLLEVSKDAAGLAGEQRGREQEQARVIESVKPV